MLVYVLIDAESYSLVLSDGSSESQMPSFPHMISIFAPRLSIASAQAHLSAVCMNS